MEHDDLGDCVPVWKTIHGDEVTCTGPNDTLWVFHKDPVNGGGIKAGDPVPEQLWKDLGPINDAAREHESKREDMVA